MVDRDRGGKVRVVREHYRAHFTKRVQGLLDELGGRIGVVLSPTYSSRLNPVEWSWLFLKSHVLSNHLHKNLVKLSRIMLRFLKQI